MRSNGVVSDDQIRSIAATINEKLVLRGPWFFQLKRGSQGGWKLLEVSCRVSGTMVYQRARGVNLPLIAIHDYLERDVTPLPNPYITLIDRNIATRAKLDIHYDHIYVDLDDTLIIDGKAVPSVLAFLYQSFAEGKKLHLITRHCQDPCDALQRAKICYELFDSVIHLKNGENKSDYIDESSIFIDNHFPERLDVSMAHDIPVLDVDAVSLFLKI